ncbi:N-acetylmuramoyl-L-alanine amidase-like domain-containing protein [Synechococcus sp. UW179A]|uniref:N-acetylmuramoyl-L-alanine amidase-like domain-containing protein n=1 Tax=Synechococcus sp. UW179A TaxID=2575510 RepID=UPI000E0F3719|nr:N-acetylmuramoyl-L-alanine amidase-like domain-containing protein [Synechococcus sp. UW179A]
MNFTAPLIAGLTSIVLVPIQQVAVGAQSAVPLRVFAGGSLSRVSRSIEDVHVVEGTRTRFKRAQSLIRALPLNEAIARLAEFFVGSPYMAMSLDQSGREQLRLDLTQFDCMLFVEQLLAVVSAESFDDFAVRTKRLRYRNGEIGYCTRQHYFHDWVGSAQAQGVIESQPVWSAQATRNLPLNFMSSHRDRYPALQSPDRFECIRAREQGRRIEQHYLPLASLEAALPSLQSGDIFAVATRVGGLDVSHMGVLIREGSRLDAIHAAPGRGVMRSRSFVRYLSSVPDAIGAVIVRPQMVQQPTFLQ